MVTVTVSVIEADPHPPTNPVLCRDAWLTHDVIIFSFALKLPLSLSARSDLKTHQILTLGYHGYSTCTYVHLPKRSANTNTGKAVGFRGSCSTLTWLALALAPSSLALVDSMLELPHCFFFFLRPQGLFSFCLFSPSV